MISMCSSWASSICALVRVANMSTMRPAAIGCGRYKTLMYSSLIIKVVSSMRLRYLSFRFWMNSELNSPSGYSLISRRTM